MKNIIIILIAFAPVALFGQSAERQVIGSTGGWATAMGIQASSTVGETVVTTGTSGSIILTHGFQQSGSGTVGIEEPTLGFSMNAYPNPASDAIILDFNVDMQQDIQIGLFDVSGKRYALPENKLSISGSMKHTVDLLPLVTGNYFIRLTNAEGSLDSSIKIQKVD